MLLLAGKVRFEHFTQHDRWRNDAQCVEPLPLPSVLFAPPCLALAMVFRLLPQQFFVPPFDLCFAATLIRDPSRHPGFDLGRLATQAIVLGSQVGPQGP